MVTLSFLFHTSLAILALELFQKLEHLIMSDDDCFELISSQGEKKSYDSVPDDTIYRVKVVGESEIPKKFGYNLRKGTEIPIEKDIGGNFV